jgi:hypothetical protein
MPIMKKNQNCNGIELVNHIKKQNKKLGDEIYAKEIERMDPQSYLDEAKKLYKDYNFI